MYSALIVGHGRDMSRSIQQNHSSRATALHHSVDSVTELSASGIVLVSVDANIVLTHPSVVKPFLSFQHHSSGFQLCKDAKLIAVIESHSTSDLADDSKVSSSTVIDCSDVLDPALPISAAVNVIQGFGTTGSASTSSWLSGVLDAEKMGCVAVLRMKQIITAQQLTRLEMKYRWNFEESVTFEDLRDNAMIHNTQKKRLQVS
jgi:hypothetical protein